ncbi:flagellar hook-length control protein FliK [Pseudomonas sp. CCI3.2]|uniref:flagellar hook-length control protein FliK n=1 Tax=unclassified Pseudomonas TaxID=196821 RepID=UPI002AC8A824|nr:MULTISPECIES: flagellar hook-length control protein FliK [unclassified Pseudomonas]MEB0078711.1 flagellar hook-length control protein FliK [Pseudomonas sp. MH10out]MEB0093231.1 flagellar hook-length control protein FliK [Pseudomonas sp. CCI4.2]MEB0103304.1 flagellar hook-length control protein FliK [Pseudomonas sp. CCI3.2]MEB0131255.1 flagellar hook-length control protein FliK [Pseudomonas sp. CCI2.4]MEB0158180.1 flagellar hook-length control protein FliK [Pseudomonas sp. AH2 (2023)]
MALAPNPLLLTTPVVKSQPTVATNVVKPVETVKDNTPSFAHVYAKQADPKPAATHEVAQKPIKDKTVVANGKAVPDAKPAASTSDVADSGKYLPADKVSNKSDGSDDSNNDDKDSDDKAKDPLALDAAPVIPVPDPTLIAAVAPPVPDPAPPVAIAPPPIEIPASMVALVVAQPATAATPATAAAAPAFDPASDPLAGLAAVQVAVQINTTKGAATTTPTDGVTATVADKKTSTTQKNTDPLLTVANNLAVPVDQQPTDNTSTNTGPGDGDQAFKGLIEGGLKDTKSAASDTRVDDFANRLAALSQAVQPKAAVSALTTTAVASPLTQPLAMHQSGWSEAVVDRVMYLSSQNLKSADIQLDPAELGRLDIRVNMAADQQTQITFMSAHVGVREALEGQMSKLRDSFAQQGLGQVDVSVFDQSRGWQGQGQNQQQTNQGQGSSSVANSGSDRHDGLDDGTIQDVAAVSQPMTVIGSSQVDYYA